MTTTLRAVVLCLVMTACKDAVCTHPPCPDPVAITLTVTSAVTGGPITNAVVQVRSPVANDFPCNGTCIVNGTFGTYELDVTAPGFQSVHRSVLVQGVDHECGCSTIETQRVNVALAP